MIIDTRKIRVDTKSINPTVILELDVLHFPEIEVLLSVKGKLLISGLNVISLLDEYQLNASNVYRLKERSSQEMDEIYKAGKTERRYIQLSGQLTPLAIEAIEMERETKSDKSISFQAHLVLSSLDLSKKHGEALALRVDKANAEFRIEQSDWVNNFAKPLGVGRFLLVELNVPEKNEVPVFWSDFFSVLKTNLADMEVCLRQGDWEKIMQLARRFFENLKIGDSKPGRRAFKSEFSELMKKSQHSEKGIEEFYAAIWKFFEYLSKYVHDIDKNGHSQPRPIPNKEDAYLAYSLALGLYNVMSKKVKNGLLS